MKNTPSFGTRLDMVRIGSTKLAVVVYITNIGSGETFPHKALVTSLLVENALYFFTSKHF